MSRVGFRGEHLTTAIICYETCSYYSTSASHLYDNCGLNNWMKVTLPLPPTINSYYSTNRQGRRFKTQEAKVWEKEAGMEIIRQGRVKFGKSNVTVAYMFYFKDNRSDYGNRVKILDDLLEKSGVMDNDRQIMEAHIYKEIDKNSPRVEVEVST